MVEKIEAKGEIAHYERFLVLSQCFQKLSTAEASSWVYTWEQVNTHPDTDDLMSFVTH